MINISTKPFRGLYVIESASTLTNQDFKDFEKRGVTHIFYSESLLLRDLTRCKSYLNIILNKLEGTDLKLYADVLPFKDGSMNPVNPNNTTHRNNIINNLKSLIDDIPELEGISFNDLQYPASIYVPEDKATEDPILTTWTETVYNAIKDYSPNHKIVGSTAYSPATPRTPNIKTLGDYLDIYMPQLYPNLQLYPSTFIYNQLDKLLDETDKGIVVDLATYTSDYDLTSRSTSDVYKDINQVLRRKEPQILGYCIYSWPYMDTSLKYPRKYKRTYSTRTYSNRTY